MGGLLSLSVADRPPLRVRPTQCPPSYYRAICPISPQALQTVLSVHFFSYIFPIIPSWLIRPKNSNKFPSQINQRLMQAAGSSEWLAWETASRRGPRCPFQGHTTTSTGLSHFGLHGPLSSIKSNQNKRKKNKQKYIYMFYMSIIY